MRGNADTRKFSDFRWSKDLSQSIFYGSSAMMAISTVADGRFLEVNEAFLSTLGFTRDEVIGRTSIELGILDAGDRQKRIEALKSGLPHGHAEMKVRCKDGSIRYGLFSAFPIDVSGSECVLTTMSDITGRKHEADLIRESEKRFRWITTELTDYLYTVKVMNGQAVETSHGAACERVTGYTAADFKADPDLWLKMVVEEDRALIVERVREILSGVKIPPIEHRIIRKDGSIRWVVDTPILHFDEEGRLESYDGVIKDITERKQAEATVRLERDFTQAVIDTLPGLFYLVDEQARLLRWNKNFEAVSGRSAEALNGMSPLDLFQEPDRAIFSGMIQKVFVAGQAAAEADVVVKKGGKVPYFFIGKLFIFEGRRCVIGIGTDISDRKLTELDLKEHERRLAELMRDLPGMVYRRANDHSWTMQFVSEGCLDLTGYKPEDLLDNRKIAFNDLVLAEYGEQLRQRWQKVLGDRSFFQGEYQIRTADGDVKWVWERGRGVYDSGGRFLFLEGYIEDVTERKQAEEEIRRLNSELEERVAMRTAQLEGANRELESFSYSISHDLRSPLRGIDGWSLALLEDCGEKLGRVGQSHIARIRAEAQRMGNLIDSLLQLSRMTRTSLKREEVDLSAIARSVADGLRESAPARQVEFVIQPGLKASGDSQLLEVALQNLLGNSFKFTGKRDKARIEFSCMELDGRNVFFVRDNGEGFDIAYSQKLFGAFQRMHKASEFPGTGIGLATVKRIILRHGGRIWAESELGRGATFFFFLGDGE